MERSEKLVTVATCSYPTEAYLLQSKLESEGIWSIVVDAETVTMNWLYSNALGGVKLKVREGDAGLAREALRVDNNQAADPGKFDKGEFCPDCGSSEIEFEKFNRRFAFLTWLLLWVPLPLWRNKWICRACGHTWRDESTNARGGAA